MSPAKILIAEDPKILPSMRQALEGYELVTPLTVKEAEKLTHSDDFDIFILGIHFDDSRGTELASIIHRVPAYENKPIVLIRCLPSTIAKFIRSSTHALKTSGTIADYFEFETTQEILGGLRESIEKHLPADKIVAGHK